MEDQKEKLEALAAETQKYVHSDSSKALKLSEQLLELATTAGNAEHIALAYNQMGFCYFNLRDLKKALNFMVKARNKYIQLEMPENIISCLTSQGAIYRQLGNYSNALKLYFKAIEICERANLTQPIIYTNIASLYLSQKKYMDALKFYQKALKLNHSLEEKSSYNTIAILTNMAYTHIELNQYEEAKKLYKDASDLGMGFEMPRLYIYALRGLGKIALSEHLTEDAKNYLTEGLKLCKETGFHIEVIKTSLLLAEALKNTNEFNKRLELLKNSLKTAVHHQNDLIEECLEKLISFYEEVEDFENAYNALKELTSLVNEQYEREKEKKIEELQAQFESREKDKLLEQERAFGKKMELRNEELRRLNAELEQFNYAVSHDLKEPIRSVQSYAQMLVMHTKERMSPHEWKAINDMDANVRRMDVMITDLMKYALLGNKELEPVSVELSEVFAIVESSLQLKIKETNATIIKSTLPAVLGFKTLLVQLFQNLLQNSLKFTREGVAPIIHIDIQQDQKTVIRFKDNGMGIPKEQVNRAFRMFTRLEKAEDIEGTGIGLSLCEKIVKKMQGSISLASDGKSYTEFTILLNSTI